VLQESNETVFDFTMCNPPFFSTVEETDSCLKARKKDRPPPSNAKTGTLSELVVPGGEEKFIEKMVQESKQFLNKVRIFTTMVGVKKHLKSSIEELKRAKVLQYTTTEFTQGRTMRWGLAWTFDEAVKLVIPKPKTKTYVPLEISFPTKLLLTSLISSVKNLLTTSLNMTILKEEATMMEVHGKTNTWSHQRRKRREQRDQEKTNSAPTETEIEESPPEKSPRRILKFTPESRYIAPVVMPHSGNCPIHSPRSESDSSSDSTGFEPDLDVGLHFHVSVTREIFQGKIKLEYLGGDFGREGLYQVLQYLKNRAQSEFA